MDALERYHHSIEAGLLSEPMLYLSLFFKLRLDEYYRLLNGVRAEEGWEP